MIKDKLKGSILNVHNNDKKKRRATEIRKQ